MPQSIKKFYPQLFSGGFDLIWLAGLFTDHYSNMNNIQQNTLQYNTLHIF